MQELLEESGAVQVPAGKHLKYRLPNGMTYIMAATPSDRRAAANQLSDLRRMLGSIPYKYLPKGPK